MGGASVGRGRGKGTDFLASRAIRISLRVLCPVGFLTSDRCLRAETGALSTVIKIIAVRAAHFSRHVIISGSAKPGSRQRPSLPLPQFSEAVWFESHGHRPSNVARTALGRMLAVSVPTQPVTRRYLFDHRSRQRASFAVTTRRKRSVRRLGITSFRMSP